MFPSYNSRSFRRIALGETASGRYLQLYPSPREQYHGGAHAALSRLDLDQRVFFYRTVVEQTLDEYRERENDDPIKHVYLLERYWPAKFNYPPGLYEAWSGTPRPDRAAWWLVGEFDVGAKEDPARLLAGALRGALP
jgi:hypothetical protein